MTTYRASSSYAVSASVTSATVPLPTGTVAGDLVIVSAHGAVADDIVNGWPSGWVSFGRYFSSGSVSADLRWKIVDAADITTGSVTLSYAFMSAGSLVITAHSFYNARAPRLVTGPTNTGSSPVTTAAYSTTAGSVLLYLAHVNDNWIINPPTWNRGTQVVNVPSVNSASSTAVSAYQETPAGALSNITATVTRAATSGGLVTTYAVVEVMDASTSVYRQTTQEMAEALLSGVSPQRRVTNEFAEVLIKDVVPQRRVTQARVEVLIAPPTVKVWDGTAFVRAQRKGAWNGTGYDPVQVRGWYDGKTVQYMNP